MGYPTKATRKLTAQIRMVNGIESLTLSDDVTLDASSANGLAIDPGGADRTVTLLAEETSNGVPFWIRNAADATEGLDIQNDGGTSIVLLGRGDSAMVACTGSAYVLLAVSRPPRNEAMTLADNLVLDLYDAQSLRIDPGGSARDVTLPAEATSQDAWFEVYNTADAAENLVVKDDGGSTIETIGQGEYAKVVCDGTSWLIQIPNH